MARYTTYIIDLYKDLMENKSDPRVKDWFLMSSPLPTVIIIFVYLLFVIRIGPMLMENRKPFKLTNIIMFYNGFQMITNTYLFYQASIPVGWMTDMQWFCQLPDYSMNPRALTVAAACWFAFINKMLDLLDTVFFVLRKKNSQISNLHLIHHSLIPLFCWIGARFLAGGSLTFFAFLNTFIHLVMYGYYMLAALGPHMQKYLWWKKYLTVMQIVQFILIIGHTLAHLFIKDCAISKLLISSIAIFTVVILILFTHFYHKEYIIRARQLQSNGIHKSK